MADDAPRWYRLMVTAAAIVIVVAGMRAAAPVLEPLLLAGFISVVCSPILHWMRDKGVPTIVAMLFVVVMLVVLGFGFIALIGNSINSFSAKLPEYEARLNAETAGAIRWLSSHGIHFSEEAALSYLDPQAGMRLVAYLLAGVAGLLSNAFLILVTVIFMLLETADFPKRLRGTPGMPSLLVHHEPIIANIRSYMAIKTLTCIFTGALVSAWLFFLGVDFWPLWGVLGMLLNFVPNIGSIIAAIPAVLLAFVQLGLDYAAVAALGYLAINTLIGYIIEPRMMGRGLGLSSLVVFMSLVFWGWVLGPVGMLLSAPLTMSLKIALESTDETRWMAVLLGPGEDGEKMEAAH